MNLSMEVNGMTQEERAALQARIDALPAGNITYKTINGKKYPYLQWQENGKLKLRPHGAFGQSPTRESRLERNF